MRLLKNWALAAVLLGLAWPAWAGVSGDVGCWGPAATEFCIEASGNLRAEDDTTTIISSVTITGTLTQNGAQSVAGALTVTDEVDIQPETAADTALHIKPSVAVTGDIIKVESWENTALFIIKSDGDVDINTLVDIDADSASDTTVQVAGAASQTSDMLLVETNGGTDALRVLANSGVMFALLTKVDLATKAIDVQGEFVQCSDCTHAYKLFQASGTTASQWWLVEDTTLGPWD